MDKKKIAIWAVFTAISAFLSGYPIKHYYANAYFREAFPYVCFSILLPTLLLATGLIKDSWRNRSIVFAVFGGISAGLALQRLGQLVTRISSESGATPKSSLLESVVLFVIFLFVSVVVGLTYKLVEGLLLNRVLRK